MCVCYVCERDDKTTVGLSSKKIDKQQEKVSVKKVSTVRGAKKREQKKRGEQKRGKEEKRGKRGGRARSE